MRFSYTHNLAAAFTEKILSNFALRQQVKPGIIQGRIYFVSRSTLSHEIVEQLYGHR